MSQAETETNDDCLRGPDGRALLQAGTKRTVAIGQLLCRQGESVESFFVLTSGMVAVSRALADKEVQLCTSGSGSILALMAAIDGQPCSVTMRALQDCNVVEIPRAALFDLLQPQRASSLGLSQDLALLTIRRLRSSTQDLAAALCRALKDATRPGGLDVVDLARIQAKIHLWQCASLAA